MLSLGLMMAGYVAVGALVFWFIYEPCPFKPCDDKFIALLCGGTWPVAVPLVAIALLWMACGRCENRRFR